MSVVITIVATLLGGSRSLAAILVWTAIGTAAAAAAFAGYEFVKRQGAEEVRAQNQKENQDAIRKGIEASRSLDDCLAARGVWDFRRQRCASAALGDR